MDDGFHAEGDKGSGSKKKTTEEFKQEVYNLVKDEYTVLGEYINSREKILMRHNICNKEFMIVPNNLLNFNSRCPNCNYDHSFYHNKILFLITKTIYLQKK